MSTELAFARKASGLTRGLSTRDLFGLAFMYIQPVMGIWIAITIGAAVFPAGNLLVALGISFVTVGVFGPLMWGILSGTMPRSGGEYVFNSRILSAPVAQAASAATMVAGFFFAFVPATWIPATVKQLCAGMGWYGAMNWATTKSAALLIGGITLVLAFVVVAFGMRVLKLIQRPLVVIGIAGPLVVIFCLALTSRAGFIANWNDLAARFGSLDYAGFSQAVANAVGGPLPQTWNWHDTFGQTGAISALLLAYQVVYVGGEVKRPQRSTLIAGWSSIAASAAVAGGTFGALYHAVGFQFVGAAAVNQFAFPPGALQGYAFPFGSDYLNLASIAVHNNRVVMWVICVMFALTSFWVIVASFLFMSRTLFAWGMDRMGPRWFTRIEPRSATPVWDFLACLILCLVGLVLYETWFRTLNLLIGVGVLYLSIFLVTGLSALVLPYRRKTRDIWNSSPYRGWKIAGVPVLTIAAVIWMLYTFVLIYYQFIDSTVRPFVGGNRQLYFVAATAVLGVSWYTFWAWRSKNVGVDVGVAYGQLPPE
jgi:basic amino acid/polyamine antiporter, APA family